MSLVSVLFLSFSYESVIEINGSIFLAHENRPSNNSSVRDPPNWTILGTGVFLKTFLLANEPFVKALYILETCAAVNVAN